MKPSLLLLAALALLAPAPLFATTIYVDDDNTGGPWDGSSAHPYQYIQDGIDNSNPNDTVMVRNGTYVGTGNKNLDFDGKSITVQSKSGALVTIIDCENSGRGFSFHSGQGPASVVDGFTITNGSITGTLHEDKGGGIYSENRNRMITRCRFADLDGNGVINGLDLTEVVSNWTTATAAAPEPTPTEAAKPGTRGRRPGIGNVRGGPGNVRTVGPRAPQHRKGR